MFYTRTQGNEGSHAGKPSLDLHLYENAEPPSMKTTLDCIPCFFRQALFAVRAATPDEAVHKELLDRVGSLLPDIPLDSSPPEIAVRVYGAVSEVTGRTDPFQALKHESTQKALALYSTLKHRIETSEDPLLTAVCTAIAGNVIDFGANPSFELEREIEELLQKPLTINHFEAFQNRLQASDWVLYLGDNAGETVFDRLLIETMGRPAVYAVRDAPFINDATREDAEMAGLSSVARIVSSGCKAPGTILAWCSDAFRATFREAPLIVSKGQGNFESLSEESGPLFHLLKVKCSVIAGVLGAPEGSFVLKQAST